MAATSLTRRHVDRFDGEGLLVIRWVKPEGEVIENASEFVKKVMLPAGTSWPARLPSLDHEQEKRYAVTRDAALAALLLDPFRFHILADVWDEVVQLARPSARMVPGSYRSSGRSKLGGSPDAPPDFEWPQFDGAPLSFVAQIDLAGVQSVCPSELLPSRGLLSFFYDAKQEAWGFDPKDKGRWRVLFFDGALAPMPAPDGLPGEAKFKEVGLEPVGELTIPESDALEVERLALDTGRRRAYDALHAELDAEHSPVTAHRVVGWAQEIQHDPAVEVQLPANGIYAGNAAGYQSAEGKRLMEERDVWRLVVQVDSEEAAGMMWGDAGRLYFMMRELDMRERAWDKAWISLQCF